MLPGHSRWAVPAAWVLRSAVETSTRRMLSVRADPFVKILGRLTIRKPRREGEIEIIQRPVYDAEATWGVVSETEVRRSVPV